MNGLVIYDSLYGNTEQIAHAMGNALAAGNDVDVLRASRVRVADLSHANLLLVGSPTQKFRPTQLIKKLLADIHKGDLIGVRVAAFDTRFAMEDMPSRILPPFVRIFGYAARPIAEGLVKKGGRLITAPEGFFVKKMEGPLREGELERAARWARQIAAAY